MTSFLRRKVFPGVVGGLAAIGLFALPGYLSCSAIPPATADKVCATAREICGVATSLCALAPGGVVGNMTVEERDLRTRLDSLAVVLAAQSVGR